MGCIQSSADPHQSNQQQVKPQLKKTPSLQQGTVQPQLQSQPQPQKIKEIKKEWPLNPNNFNKLPQIIKDKYKKAKEKGIFEDLQFPRNQSSLGGPQYQDKIQPFLPTLVWLKPPQFFNSSFVLFDGIDPNDIKQGQLGVCYCLATIANYATDPQKVVEIFPFYDLQLGFYVLRFYTNGKPNYVIVDDYFPCNSQSNSPLFTNPIGNQIWVLLIEKAWAKVMGSYFSAESMSADFFMEDFTGCPSYGIWFKDKEDKFQQIVSCLNSDYLVVLTTGEKQIEGIVNGHAYSLLKVVQHNGSYVFQIRNPWGAFQWNGQYGEQSSLWTPELRRKCGQKKGDDGVFFLSESELLQAFVYYSIGLDQDNSKYSFVEFQSQPQQSLYFKFELTKKGNMAIRITQPFDRLIKDKDYKYSPLVFEVGKIENKEEVTFYSEGGAKCFYGQKSVYATDEVYNEYQPGDYLVRIKMQWVNPKKYNSAVLSVYCKQSVTIERIKQPEGFRLWRQMIYNYMQNKQLTDLDQNIAFAMQWMKGQMICYTAIREQGKPNNYKIRWTFDSKEFKNCKLAINRTNDNVIEYTMDKKEKYDFGTANHVLLSEDCGAGSAEVQVI